MIEIDGSRGEGGGQILRSALTLSLITGHPFTLRDIRARRAKAGLAPQHLAAVQLAAAIGQAEVEGDRIGAHELTFRPHTLRADHYHQDVGTAGATPLLAQTALLPLALARHASRLTLSGGTHVRWSPCAHYLEWQWLPYLREMGVETTFRLERAGFYPRGNGAIELTVEPAERLLPLHLTRSGALLGVRGLSAVADLPREIAERQARRADHLLHGITPESAVEVAELPAGSPGTLLILLAEFEYSRACFFALGERGKRAEQVADEAVDALREFLATDAAIDPWLADQLLLPLALADGESQLRTPAVTGHLRTNLEVIEAFLPDTVTLEGADDAPGDLYIHGHGLP
ncbi:RNA 3'-terminal phosphate cyclase [Endothiovibrio diazotrophicus]